MKIIQRKILPWIVSEKRLCARQKGSLPRNGLQEHVFSIRAIIEDFKNSSGRLYVYFMDITDAFGSIPHDLMISELRDAGYPEWLCSLTKEIYTGSSFRIRTKNGLSDVVVRRKGIIQGDPWSVILFEQGIDRWLRGIQSLATEETNPTGFGYVDAVNMRSNNRKTGDEMLSRTADFLDFTGMQVKHRKCAILQGKRSGVNWKELNNREVVKTSIQGSYIPVLARNKPKEYLGHLLSIDGSGENEQLQNIDEFFKDNLKYISDSPLPVGAKIEAINTILMPKLMFYFSNITFSEKRLQDMESLIVNAVRQWLRLNKSSTRAFMFTSKKHGGLGILKPSTMYKAKKISFIISVLNSDDQNVRILARKSLELHMSKRKVPLVQEEEDNFLGYE